MFYTKLQCASGKSNSMDDSTIDSLTFLAMVANDECDLSDVIVNTSENFNSIPLIYSYM